MLNTRIWLWGVAALAFGASATADLVIANGTRIVYPDGTEQGTAAVVPNDHGVANGSSIGTGSFVGGGRSNHGDGAFSTIAGGNASRTAGDYATVSGGRSNIASAYAATIAGGADHEATQPGASVLGGRIGSATGEYSVTLGGIGAAASGNRAASGGAQGGSASGDYSFVGGGFENSATGTSSTLSGGSSNDSDGTFSTLAGGVTSFARNNDSTVGGGRDSKAWAKGATVSGGLVNLAEGSYAAVSGGFFNTASGVESYVGSGFENLASGQWSTIPGGESVIAAGEASFAAGRDALVAASHDGGIALSARTTAANQFAAFGEKGVRLVSAIGQTDGTPLAGVQIPQFGSSWGVLSKADSKENFVSIDPEQIAEAAAGMPLTRWNYRHQDESVQHIGPMAEDFHTAFGLSGAYTGTLATQDVDGIVIASIQGLYRMIERRDAAIRARRDRQAVLRAQIERFESVLAGTGSASAAETATPDHYETMQETNERSAK